MNKQIALIGMALSFALFLDSIDLILDKSVDKTYKIVRTLSIWFNILAMLHFYFIL